MQPIVAAAGAFSPWALLAVTSIVGVAIAGLLLARRGPAAGAHRGSLPDGATTRRECWLTAAGLAGTLAAALLTIADILTILGEHVAARRWGAALGQGLFLVFVAYFVYGACVYLLARLGHLRRLLDHVPVSAEALREVYGKARTGCPVLVNTSFNVRGEPIVCTPEDAFRCFMGTDIEVLAIGRCLLRKDDQDPRLRRSYKDSFELD